MMLHRVMFSGNVKKNNSTIITEDDATRVIQHANENTYTGFTIYVDGNYITLYEGDKTRIENSINHYADSPRYSPITTMLSRPVEQRSFDDFKLGLRHLDSRNVLGSVGQTFVLTPYNFNQAVPSTLPADYKLLLKSFSRVNNIVLMDMDNVA